MSVKAKVHLLVDEGVADYEVKRAKNRVREAYKDILSFSFYKEKVSSKDIPWGDKYIKRLWVKKKCAEIEERYGYSRDIVAYIVSDKKWKGPRNLLGFMLGGRYSSYVFCATRQRNKLSDTFLHEQLHNDRQIVLFELGKLLSKEIGFPWKEAVHGDRDGYREYHYRKALEQVAPLLQEAYEKRRKKEKIQKSILRLTIRWLKEIIKNLSSKDEPFTDTKRS